MDLIQIGEKANKLSVKFPKQINKGKLKEVLEIRTRLIQNVYKIIWIAINGKLPDLILETNNINFFI